MLLSMTSITITERNVSQHPGPVQQQYNITTPNVKHNNIMQTKNIPSLPWLTLHPAPSPCPSRCHLDSPFPLRPPAATLASSCSGWVISEQQTTTEQIPDRELETSEQWHQCQHGPGPGTLLRPDQEILQSLPQVRHRQGRQHQWQGAGQNIAIHWTQPHRGWGSGISKYLS